MNSLDKTAWELLNQEIGYSVGNLVAMKGFSLDMALSPRPTQ